MKQHSHLPQKRTLGQQPAFPGFSYSDGRGPSKRRTPSKMGPSGEVETYCPGMTLRHHIAITALGAKSQSGLIGYEDYAPKHRAELIRRLTRDCIEIADALLEQLAKEQT